MKEPVNDSPLVDQAEMPGLEGGGGQTRRELLQGLAAVGGAMVLQPREWVKPVIKAGVLPPHAQMSPVPYTILGCVAQNVRGGEAAVSPMSTVRTWIEISPADPGIEMQCTITLNEPGHPQNGVLSVMNGTTDAAGRFQAPDLDLSALSELVTPGTGRITVTWTFVNALEGVGNCQCSIDVVDLRYISTCTVLDAEGGNVIGPWSELVTRAVIEPQDAGIALRRTITLNQAGHPQDGVVDETVAFTDATGACEPANFLLNQAFEPPIEPGIDRLSVRWEFVYPDDGTGACVNLIEIVDLMT